MNNRQIWNFVVKTYLGWVVIILFITYYGLSIIPHVVGPGQLEWSNSSLDYWIRWSNWDGGHFRGIAENGYLYPFQVVFFPLYPMLIKALMLVGLPSLWGGLIISQLTTLVSLFYLYKLARLDFNLTVSWRVIFLLLIFPTSFYLVAVYSESLFLALSLTAFYYARKGKWWLAALLAALSSVTRLVGLGVILAVAIEYYLTIKPQLSFKNFWQYPLNRLLVYFFLSNWLFMGLKGWLSTHSHWLVLGVVDTISQPLGIITASLAIGLLIYYLIKQVDLKKIYSLPSLWLSLAALPFLSYLYYLNLTQQDSWALVNQETSWGRSLTLPWETIINYHTRLTMVDFFAVGPTAQTLLEFIFLLILLGCLMLSLKKLRLSYSLYFLITLIIPLSSGTLIAIHRYGLVVFPVILILANINNDHFQKVWLIFSITLLGILSVLFINHYWVS